MERDCFSFVQSLKTGYKRGAMKILLVAANPKDTVRLEVDKEWRAIAEKLKTLHHKAKIQTVFCPAARPNDVRAALYEHRPEVVHFSGHGNDPDGILMEGEDGKIKAVSAEALGELFVLFKDTVRLVVLNACYSESQAKAISEHIDCVIGMRDAVADLAAIEFSVAFYEALGNERSVLDAFRAGYNAPGLNDIPGEYKPALLERQTGMAQEILLRSTPLAPKTPPPNPTEIVEKLETCLKVWERKNKLEPGRRKELEKEIDGYVLELKKKPMPERGQSIAGTELIREIEGGNFAMVWQSRDLKTGESRATKIFHRDKLTQGRMLYRFRRSITAMERLREHRDAPRSIVRIRSVEEDRLAFAMDYLPGGNLVDVEDRGWKLEKKIQVMCEIGEAVAFAHRMGVIHRDIKPGNVVLDSQGHPVLTDFDIADILFLTRLSVPSGGLGTQIFAAPEQLVEADTATERADIYSLGRLLYYLLLERPPGLQVEDDPALENLGGYPAALVAIVRKATQYKPERRYANVEEMMGELRRYESRGARIRAKVGLGYRWAKRYWPMLVILVMVVIGLGASAIYFRRQAELERITAEQAKKSEEESRAREALALELAGLGEGIKKAMEELGSVQAEIGRLEGLLDGVEKRLGTGKLGEKEREGLEAEKKGLELKLSEKRKRWEEIQNELKEKEKQRAALAEKVGKRPLGMALGSAAPGSAAPGSAAPGSAATAPPLIPEPKATGSSRPVDDRGGGFL